MRGRYVSPQLRPASEEVSHEIKVGLPEEIRDKIFGGFFKINPLSLRAFFTAARHKWRADQFFEHRRFPIECLEYRWQHRPLPTTSHARKDLSSYVIHFTKGNSERDAFEILIKILGDRKLLASAGFVKGGIPCVSFTEAPFGILAEGFTNADGATRYSGFGLRFSKAHIFALGGRPVIYQSDAEYYSLPPASRWRHVRFEPLGDSPIDWTWEREWRLCCDGLQFSEKEIEVVVPDEATAQKLRTRIEHDSFHNAWAWEVVLGDIAWMSHGPNPWQILKP